MAQHTGILAIEEGRGTVLLGIIERQTLCQMRGRRGYRAQEEQRRPQGAVRRHKHGSVLDLSRQGEELLTQDLRHLMLGGHMMTIPQTTQYEEKLRGIVEVLTELPSTRVGLSHFRSGVAFGGSQRG